MALNVVATIKVGKTPFGAAISNDGGRVYVGNFDDDTVSVVDTLTQDVVATIPLGSPSAPMTVAVRPDGARAYVPCTAGSDNAVRVIDTITHSVVTSIPFTGHLGGTAVSADGTRCYVVIAGIDGVDDSGGVAVVDTATNSVTATIKVTRSPRFPAVSADGALLYVTCLSAPNVVNDGSVAVIDTATNKVITAISVGDEPDGIAVSPDGGRVYAYVTDVMGNAGRVAVIDTATNTLVTAIPVGLGPGNIAVSPDGAVAYATNMFDGTLSVIDTASDSVTDTVALVPGGGLWGPVVSPDGTLIYVTRPTDDTVTVLQPTPRLTAPSRVTDLVGQLLGGVANDGGGWLVIGDHFYKIPPRPEIAVSIARAAAPHLGRAVTNPKLAEQVRAQGRTVSLESR